MPNEISYFTQFTLPSAHLADIQSEYVNWVLGTGSHFKSNDARRLEGVDSRWKFSHVINAKRLRGQNDYELESRQHEKHWILRFRFRDRADPAVLFEHQVRVERTDNGVNVQHGIRRSAPQLLPLRFSPRPRIVSNLTRRFPDISPLNLDRKPIRLPASDVDDFVRHQLLDSRSVGWVIISPQALTNQPLIDPDKIAIWLQGIAAVAVLDSDAARGFNNALARRDLVEGFRCFDGALRAYDLSRGTERLPVLFPHQLEPLLEPERTSFAGADLARRLSVRAMPPRFFTLIEEEDRLERSRLVAEISARSSADAGVQAALQDLQQLFEESEKENRELEQQNGELSVARQQAELDRDLIAEEVSSERGKTAIEIRRLNDELERIRASSKAVRLPPHVLDGISKIMKEQHSVEHSLSVAEAIFWDRLIVLDTARKSAKKAAGFIYPKIVSSLLARLATDYFDALERSGDIEARKIFGSNEYAAKEAELSNEGKALRTFTWNNKEHLVESHLKHGVKFSDAECLRIHFQWDPEQKRIVIAHCGGHLNL